MKSLGILYLFDMDGTLFGKEKWDGVLSNYIENIKSPVYINPSNYDIRWSILTGRPKIDKLFIKMLCILKGLFPEKIITINKWFYPFKNDQEKFNWKYQIMKNILYCQPFVNNRMITKIVYIDNDFDTNKYINSKNLSNLIAINVADFLNKKYQFFL